ncbi:M12 family metallopeptidase [Sphingobacterium chungjuense]|uniref:M12 family metallopeptidase n=1 Tax=Sphingobacterium chungjuense TaxID=2675553 RepID=UPI0019D2BC20|nr:M12 family metallopeptidase [Sphingobacterium chungjuense]
MKKQTIYLICFTVFLMGACKQELVQSVSDESEYFSTTVLSDSTKLHKLIIEGNDTYVKEVNGEYFFSEDLTITKEQFDILRKMTNPRLSTTERATITRNLNQTWPNRTVFYRLPEQGSLSANNYNIFLSNIRNAFNLITAETSVRFVERTTEPEYINFVYSNVNSSPLGWSRGRVNQINIFNITFPAIIAHEIMHSMAIMHEQTRPDRDSYIHVYIDRVPVAARNNFNILPGYVDHGAFDFESVMMYGSFDFSIDRSLPVLTRLDGSTWNSQRTRLTAGDYAGINALY